MKYIGVLIILNVIFMLMQHPSGTNLPAKLPSFNARDEAESRDDNACAFGTQPIILSEPSGWFASPEYPRNYPNNANCQWLIVSQNTQQIIRLDFNEIRMEAGYDLLVIYDGNQTSAPPIAMFEGVNWYPAPTNIRSSGPSLLIVLVTDYSIVNYGFNATYTSIALDLTPDPCYPLSRPVLLDAYNGTFQSPGYFDNKYWNYADCSWLIESQEVGGTVQLWFDSFETETNYDVVWIYDGQSTAGQLIGIVHGKSVNNTDRPLTFRSFRLVSSLSSLRCTFDFSGNATSLVIQGGNFGCLLSTSNDFADAVNSCFDNYQWSAKLSQCYNCPYMFVCLRLPKLVTKL